MEKIKGGHYNGSWSNIVIQNANIGSSRGSNALFLILNRQIRTGAIAGDHAATIRS